MQQQVYRFVDPSLRTLTTDLADVVDGELVELMQTAGIALLAHELSELREIDQALQRIGDGTYGTCSECGRAIDPVRLNARPAARQCLTCKEAFEKRRGIVGKPTV